ncbi:MAG: hypothetical protein ABUL48_02360, partial [Pseudorhodoplanes sp.]
LFVVNVRLRAISKLQLHFSVCRNSLLPALSSVSQKNADDANKNAFAARANSRQTHLLLIHQFQVKSHVRT